MLTEDKNVEESAPCNSCEDHPSQVQPILEESRGKDVSLFPGPVNKEEPTTDNQVAEGERQVVAEVEQEVESVTLLKEAFDQEEGIKLVATISKKKERQGYCS